MSRATLTHTPAIRRLLAALNGGSGASRPGRWLRELSALVIVGLCTIAGVTLNDIRLDAWSRARETSQNLLKVLENDIDRNIELYDLSLRAAIDGLQLPGFAALDPVTRHAVLFDRSTTARFLGAVLVLGPNGDVQHDSLSFIPRKANLADRDYFTFHRDNVGDGLYVSQPYRSSRTGEWSLGISRRIEGKDGRFGGVVMGSLRLSYFRGLFARLDVGPNGSVNLFRSDGTALMRQPYDDGWIGRSIARADTFRHMSATRSGTFVGISSGDGVERLYSFMRVGDLPLIMNVAFGVDDILANWRRKAVVIGFAVLALCGVTGFLTMALGREFRRRSGTEQELRRLNGDLAELAVTDPLTGLYNRRRFDDLIAREWHRAARSGQTIGLVTADVDSFKAFNDTYGHAAGDGALRRVASALREGIRTPLDVACRLGGEEFAVLLPESDARTTLAVAERLRRSVEELGIPHSGSARGTLTASFGMIACRPATGGDIASFIEAADAALYAAKAGGRNRVCTAGAGLAAPPEREAA